MDPLVENAMLHTRRQALLGGGRGLGGIALAAMMATDNAQAAKLTPMSLDNGGTLERTHFPAKAKRVIYLFFSGGPSHIDLFDYKPAMREFHGEELPDSIRMDNVSPA